ncbi:L-histidine N(alpha)-methyltransferase [Spiribacter halobius]|uniref:L-histidine N(Alpha)-methyltransferase n=1 Tax=Sediminicurvatus halobius TaxID=2182432 RepID=A0A2U2N6Z5_9GAMM|nr:L-histidine N(alpha)-methyltransferase [Spiribacter halobius]PWG64837.1 L-histidine N(alpha)-methyltransferase [Spiribacter halobius]UEX78308.1 L-histidine N(alpha)-methyltransferase [Spiribacter halobius]
MTGTEDAFRRDVLEGLARSPKRIPSAWLYDQRGSELFEEITRLPEYYPTRTELAILDGNMEEIAEAIGPEALVVELGSGSSRKTGPLLAALSRPAGYVPVDISEEYLHEAARSLQGAFPELTVQPVVADFTADFGLPDGLPAHRRRAGFFPGSTLGNLDDEAAGALLARCRRLLGADGCLVLGLDLDKPASVLIPAYDDAAGVTAEFNRNLLRRINRELGGDFDPEAFRHEARYADDPPRVEMHLIAERPQTVTVAGERFRFEAGESLHTETSHKYTRDGFAALAAAGGWDCERWWTDADGWFAVVLLV